MVWSIQYNLRISPCPLGLRCQFAEHKMYTNNPGEPSAWHYLLSSVINSIGNKIIGINVVLSIHLAKCRKLGSAGLQEGPIDF